MDITQTDHSESFDSICVDEIETSNVSPSILPYEVPTKRTVGALHEEIPVTTANSLVLTKVSPLSTQLHNLLADRTEISIQISPIDSLEFSLGACTSLSKLSYSLHFLVNHKCVEFELDRTLLTALVFKHMSGIPFDIIPQKLKLSILQAVCAPLIETVANCIDEPIELIAIKTYCLDQEDKPNNTQAQLSLKGLNAGYPFHAYLSLTQDNLPLLATFIKKFSITKTPKIDINTLPLWVSASICGLKLRHLEIDNLEINDLIILDTPFSTYMENISISAGGKHLFNARYDAGELIISQQRKELTMSETLTAIENEDEDDNTSIGNIRVDIVFELARQLTTLDELSKLAPGQLFDLEKPLRSPVTVRANGISIANAELVEINDHVGARITSLLTKEG